MHFKDFALEGYVALVEKGRIGYDSSSARYVLIILSVQNSTFRIDQKSFFPDMRICGSVLNQGI